MSIRPMFAWYDMWVGAFWDSRKRRLYIFPVPMLGVVIQLRVPQQWVHVETTAGGTWIERCNRCQEVRYVGK